MPRSEVGPECMSFRVGRSDQPEQWGWMCSRCHRSVRDLTEQQAWDQARAHREGKCFHD